MNYQKLYHQEVKNITQILKKKYRPEKIILFGSGANGKIKPSSDIDMMIIKKSNKRRVDRIKEVLMMIDNNLPFEPLVYTPSEIKKRVAMGDFFVQNVIQKGKTLYEK